MNGRGRGDIDGAVRRHGIALVAHPIVARAARRCSLCLDAIARLRSCGPRAALLLIVQSASAPRCEGHAPASSHPHTPRSMNARRRDADASPSAVRVGLFVLDGGHYAEHRAGRFDKPIVTRTVELVSRFGDPAEQRPVQSLRVTVRVAQLVASSPASPAPKPAARHRRPAHRPDRGRCHRPR